MALTRDELAKLIADLEAAMPALMHAYPDAADFNCAFAEMADSITDNAGADDDAWVHGGIDKILEAHGLWRPGLDDLPADD